MYNYLFIANLPPTTLFHGGEHLWSLCVEMQFYVGVALIAEVFGPRGLCLLPLFSLSVTAIRIADGAGISIFTYERLDEILAGATFALIYYRWPRLTLPAWLTLSMFPLTLIASHEGTGYFMYLRPYLAATMVGTSIYAAPVRMRQLFELPMTIYIAKISYGLYVLHGMFSATWLGTGSPLPRYAKRPLLVLTTFAAADFSYRYYETPARRWAQKLLSSGPFKQV